MSVSDHTAVVTGAGSKRGIGRATAHALAAAGWNVAVLDLDEAGAKDIADEIAEQHGVQAVGVGCDVTDAASVENALATVAAAVPPVGAVVNNAGITSPTPFLKVTAEEWERIFAVNVRGSYNVTRQLAPGMVERGFGRIIAVTTTFTAAPGPRMSAYVAPKVAQEAILRVVAREVAGTGVTANVIAVKSIDAKHERESDPSPKNAAWTTPEEIVATMRFLCSDEAGTINGARIPLDGR